MKYLKRINELFDDEFQKNLHEIPYLKGEITPQKISSGQNLLGMSDRMLNQLCHSCPWIIELGYRRSGSILSVGFSNSLRHSAKDEVFYFLNIEIVDYGRDLYNLNFTSKVIGNGREIYNDSIKNSQMDLNQLINYLNKIIYPMVVDFNNYLSKMFDEKPVSYTDKKVRPFNPKFN
jgi:hypothetical protein